jgi:outer membrane protein assembly factor BamB
VLYALQTGWTKGDPILVLDPGDGRELRRVVTEANKTQRSSGASGIAFHADNLYVQTMLQGLYIVDPKTGEIVAHLRNATRYVSGLAFDGAHLVTASREMLYLLDPKTAAVVRSVPLNYPVRSLTAAAGVYHLMEQPVWGHDRDHERQQVWPLEVWVHRLVLAN